MLTSQLSLYSVSSFTSLFCPKWKLFAKYVVVPIQYTYSWMWIVNQGPRSPFHSQVGRSSIPALDMDASCSQIPQNVHRLAIISTILLCVWGWCNTDESFPPLGHVESILTCNMQIRASTSHLALPHRFSGFESWEHVSTHRYASFSNIQELLLLGANQCHEGELLTSVIMTNWWPVFSYNSSPKNLHIVK
jgi:hypothetical protein